MMTRPLVGSRRLSMDTHFLSTLFPDQELKLKKLLLWKQLEAFNYFRKDDVT